METWCLNSFRPLSQNTGATSNVHASLGDIMLDLVQNAIEAHATRIEVTMTDLGHELAVVVCDNGCGMDETTLSRAMDPFFTDGTKHKQRRFGLGLPFLKQQVEATGGKLAIQSAPGNGTTLSFSLDMNHLDAPPMRDLPDAVAAMMNFDGAYELRFHRKSPAKEYCISRSELLDALGGLNSSDELALARRFISEQEKDFLH